jgi:hypothetical protein
MEGLPFSSVFGPGGDDAALHMIKEQALSLSNVEKA